MSPLYDMMCTNEECDHKEKDRVVSYDERNNQVCPVCGSPLKIDYNGFRHTLIGVG